MTSVAELTCKALTTLTDGIKILKSRDECIRWLKHVNKFILLTNRAIKKNGENNGNLFQLESNLGLFKYYREKLKKHKRGIYGKGLHSPKLFWHDLESCFNCRIRTGIIVNLNYQDPSLFLNKCFRIFSNKVKNALKFSNLKVNLAFSANYILPKTGVVETKSFNTANSVITKSTCLKQWFSDNIDKIEAKLSEFQERDSGWTLFEILYLKININVYSPIFGGTYIELPKDIKNKGAIINIKNNDNYCFLWAVVSALFPVDKNSNQLSSYPHFHSVLKYEGIHFPMQLKDVSKFEKMNNLSINVYSLQKIKKANNQLVPLYLSKFEGEKFIHLLMLSNNNDDDNDNDDYENMEVDENVIKNVKNNTNYHFAWIKNLPRLISKQVSNHNGRIFLCDRCLNHFLSKTAFEKHLTDCKLINKCRVELPNENNKYLKFKNFRYQDVVPFVIYADLESILQKIDDTENKNTVHTHKHIPSSIAYYVKCSYDDNLSYFRLNRSENCIDWFSLELYSLAQFINDKFQNSITLQMTKEEEDVYLNAKICHICKREFFEFDIKVRDHNHFTGAFRGAAHQSCNLNFKKSHTIPVVFHNLSNYDGHFLIKNISKKIPGGVSLLPVNKERYISFTKNIQDTNIKLRFIDSFRFMPSSIEKLSSYLNDDEKTITQKFCKDTRQFKLLTRKGVFPYEYLDNWDKFQETSLPNQNLFYSSLKNENITDDDYEHAKLVWQTFNMKTLGEYSDLYLATDVHLLADVFENFRSNCLQTYKLDALHYYTAPGLAFDAMLKYTNITLELLTDIEKVLFIEKGIRGGLVQCSKRYAEANNKYLNKLYNSDEEDTYLMYFDVNNLYGAAMSHCLPYGEFSWVDKAEFYHIDLMNLSEILEFGFIFEVDLDYPESLHELH